MLSEERMRFAETMASKGFGVCLTVDEALDLMAEVRRLRAENEALRLSTPEGRDPLYYFNRDTMN